MFTRTPNLLLSAKQPSQVDVSVRTSALIGGQVHGLDRRRSLGDVVDQAAGRSHSAFHARDALEEFDALLVFERHVLFAGDRHAVDLEAGRKIDRKSANLKIAVIADRRIVLADRGIVLHHVGKHARNLVREQVAGHDGYRERRLAERRAIEGSRRHGLREGNRP